MISLNKIRTSDLSLFIDTRTSFTSNSTDWSPTSYSVLARTYKRYVCRRRNHHKGKYCMRPLTFASCTFLLNSFLITMAGTAASTRVVLRPHDNCADPSTGFNGKAAKGPIRICTYLYNRRTGIHNLYCIVLVADRRHSDGEPTV